MTALEIVEALPEWATLPIGAPGPVFEGLLGTDGRRLGLSRSRLYATALEDFDAKHQAQKVTERLNAVYASQDSQVDRATRRLQARSLSENPW